MQEFPSRGEVAEILKGFLTGGFSPDSNGYPTASQSTGSGQDGLRGV